MFEHAHLEAFRFLQAGSAYTDAAELEAHFERVLASFGFGPYGCVRVDERQPGGTARLIAGRGFEDWDRHYTEQGYEACDPVRAWAKAGRPYYSWSEAKAWRSRQPRPEPANDEAMWSDAAQAGLNNGMVIRAVAPGGHLLIARIATGEHRIRPADKGVIDSVAICFLNWRMRLLEWASDPPGEGSLLTVREVECLRWVGQGLTDYAIAEQMQISASTVNKHLETAKRKLGVQKRVLAYRRAAELGLLGTYGFTP